VPLSKHYSGGHLFSVSVFGEAESCCKGPCDCCSTEHEYYKLDVDYVISSFECPDVKIIDSFQLFSVFPKLSNINENLVGNPVELRVDLPPPEIYHSISFLQSFLC